MRRSFLILGALAGLTLALPSREATKNTSASNKPQPTTDSASNDNGIARWLSGAPGSDQFYSDGALVESLTANGITVQVSLYDTGWKLRAFVAIANESSAQVSVNPRLFTLDELTPHLRSLAVQDPARLAKGVTHQIYSSPASATAPAGSVQQPSSAAYLITRYTPSEHAAAPNYFAQPQAGRQSQSVLRECTIDPKQTVSGAVWFERGKNPQQLNLRVFVGDQIFEFPLSFPPH